MQEKIKVGYQTFISDGGEEFGAVRQVAPNGQAELVIYVENSGEFTVSFDAVESVHFEKGHPELRQTGSPLASGYRPRARRRKAWRITRSGSASE
jgi:uncharacterized cupin superfamily protein